MAAPLRSPPIHAAPLRHTARETPSARLRSKNVKTRLHPTLPRAKLRLTAAAAAATTVKAAGGGVVDGASGESENKTNDEIKAALYRALEGINRGIFGTTSENKYEIERLVKLLESQNPTPDPTDNLLETVDGSWKLVYSTVTILGAKRTKLGLRDFISLGDFFQIIEVEKGRATNVIKFNAKGLKMLTGQLIIEASFSIASKMRVNIKLEKSSITPDQLMNLFQKNYDVLLAVFNPEGWLEITYVDGSMRIGRDDKGNIFILERFEEGNI